MKKTTILLFGILIGFQSFGQDPELFRTWNLYKMEFDFGGTLYIEEIDPPIFPYLIVNQDLSFEGFGACNSFLGNFLYDEVEDKLIPFNYADTTEDCETEFHDSFELYYFEYFSLEQAHYYRIEISPNDNLYHMYFGHETLGYWLEFIEGKPLSIVENNSEKIQIYPNPVSDQLFISSEKVVVKAVAVFSTTGQKVLEIDAPSNSIDVSSFSKGIYFLEINSEEGKSIEKFIKK